MVRGGREGAYVEFRGSVLFLVGRETPGAAPVRAWGSGSGNARGYDGHTGGLRVGLPRGENGRGGTALGMRVPLLVSITI